jgi:hypothetical protein
MLVTPGDCVRCHRRTDGCTGSREASAATPRARGVCVEPPDSVDTWSPWLQACIEKEDPDAWVKEYSRCPPMHPRGARGAFGPSTRPGQSGQRATGSARSRWCLADPCSERAPEPLAQVSGRAVRWTLSTTHRAGIEHVLKGHAAEVLRCRPLTTSQACIPMAECRLDLTVFLYGACPISGSSKAKAFSLRSTSQ